MGGSSLSLSGLYKANSDLTVGGQASYSKASGPTGLLSAKFGLDQVGTSLVARVQSGQDGMDGYVLGLTYAQKLNFGASMKVTGIIGISDPLQTKFGTEITL